MCFPCTKNTQGAQSPPPSDPVKADKGLKMAGNQLFRMGRYQEALSAYLSANDADTEIQQTLEKLALSRQSDKS